MIMLMPLALFAAEPPVQLVIDGEAFGNDLEAPRELFERAKADASRKAIEQAVGTFIRSNTIVSNGQLAEELVYARVRGKIDKMEVLSQERDKADPYHYLVRIKATVSPVFNDNGVGIKIKAWLPRAELSENDAVSLEYQVNEECYVYIFVIGADNSVTQLLPNAMIKDNHTKAGQALVFPPEGSGINLKASLLPAYRHTGAVERIKIIATKSVEPILYSGFQEGFKVYDAKSTGLASDLLKRLNQLEPSDWGDATVAYKIAPQ